MAEVEVKVLLSNAELSAFKRTLASEVAKKRAKRLGKVVERNFIVDFSDKALSRKGCLLRVRDKSGTVIITLKGPKAKGAKFKTREELEFSMPKGTDYRKVVVSLARAGIAVQWRYDKVRESFSFEGAHIDVDALPLLGTIVEVESDSEKKVQSAITSLGLSKAKKSNGSYYDLAKEYFGKKGLPVRNLILKRR